MTVNQRDVEASLSPAASVFVADVGHTAQLIGDDAPKVTQGKLRSHLTRFGEAVAKELAPEALR